MTPSDLKKERLIAFGIDYLLLITFQGIVGQILMLNTDNSNLVNMILFLTLITSVIMFCKDLIKGQSIGKRIMKIAVVNADDLTICSNPFKLILRNITLPLWPIEAILFLSSENGVRLGDKLTNTTVKKLS